MTEDQAGRDPRPGMARAAVPAADLLDTVADLPLDRHPDVYERVHAELRSALTDINDA